MDSRKKKNRPPTSRAALMCAAPSALKRTSRLAE
jgi:hypothetical protein